MKKICMVIPVFNDWDIVVSNKDKFLEIIERYGRLVDIVFVDNGSKNVPFEELENLEVLVCEVPGSYNARNVALAQGFGSYEYFLFTDADCTPSDELVSCILKEVDSGFDILAGGVEVFSKNIKANSVECYDLILGLPQERYVRSGYGVTANLTVSSIVFKTVGFFDGKRFSGGDGDLCRRALKAGFSIKYCKEAKVYHPARDKWKDITNKIRRVSGGQCGNGDLSRKVKFLVVNILPPVRGYRFAFFSEKEFPISCKLRAAFVLTVLWPVRAFESVKAFLFGPRVR
jgi:GT2 family glycosyltransferase